MIIKIDTDKLANIGDFIQDMPYPKVIDTLYRWKSEIAAAMLQAQMDERKRTVCAVGSKEWLAKVQEPAPFSVEVSDEPGPAPTGLMKPVTQSHKLKPYSVKPEAQSISHDAFRVMKPGFNGGDES